MGCGQRGVLRNDDVTVLSVEWQPAALQPWRNPPKRRRRSRRRAAVCGKMTPLRWQLILRENRDAGIALGSPAVSAIWRGRHRKNITKRFRTRARPLSMRAARRPAGADACSVCRAHYGNFASVYQMVCANQRVWAVRCFFCAISPITRSATPPSAATWRRRNSPTWSISPF